MFRLFPILIVLKRVSDSLRRKSFCYLVEFVIGDALGISVAIDNSGWISICIVGELSYNSCGKN